MLTGETKSRINTCRDILVGKIPDPKGQIEQITNALIYKFMDDQDQESKSLGGKASHFVGELESYSWHKLFDPRLNNQERADLYREGLEKLALAKSLPDFFRDVFKNTYLPFRDAGTISMFIKEINGFEYRNEELGNAFEYLLSIMGSQGNAGQFRTPRNIIEFIVDAVDPHKDESILDPACGTAGFLVESYTHISGKGDLNLHDKKLLAGNIKGVDIDPGMAKIARVNLYLHGFASPKITEDDTLSDEKLWLNEKYDVILANPPFMTPKGGITPHKKFTVSSNRAEVLFVDYIAEHLKLNGRAGIIVPEGIIFQSGKAYKQLRKKLVDDGYLWAVISLPSGVFQPYSGVKTSILLLDRERARSNENILFIKINSDGYDLGAQRRPIDKNELPEALRIINEYKVAANPHSPNNNPNVAESSRFPHGDQEVSATINPEIAHVVPKKTIAESGDYNLSGDRYVATKDYTNTKWPMVELGEVCKLVRGVTYNKDDVVEEDGNKILRANNINLDGTLNLTDIKLIKKELKEQQKLIKGDIFICLASGSKDHIGKSAYIKSNTDFYFGGFMGCIRVFEKVNSKYLYSLINSELFNSYINSQISGVNINNLNQKILYNYKIPLPPLSVQQEIVDEIEGYQKIIDGARQLVDNWKPTFEIDLTWEKVKLGEVCDVRDGTHDSPKYINKGIPLVTSKNLKNDFIDFENVHYISKEDHIKISKRSGVDDGDVLFAMIGTIGNPVVVKKTFEFSIKNVALFKFKQNEGLNNIFIKELLDSSYTKNNLMTKSRGGTQKFVSLTDIRNFEIPLPPIQTQKEIVEKIEAERRLVEGAKQLIEIYESKIKSRITKIWQDE